MAKVTMGSTGRDELLSSAAAVKLLGISKRTLSRWIKEGILEPHYDRHRAYFQRTDVEVLTEVAGTTDSDLPTVARQSRLAYVAARRTEERLAELTELLGLNRPLLNLDDASVKGLYEQACGDLKDAAPAAPDRSRKWAARFFSIDEHYLGLVGKVTRTAEPWKVFVDLGDKLASTLPSSPEHVHTRMYLDTARDRLRHVSYFACRKIYGRRLADRIFEEDQDITSRLVRILDVTREHPAGPAPAPLLAFLESH